MPRRVRVFYSASICSGSSASTISCSIGGRNILNACFLTEIVISPLVAAVFAVERPRQFGAVKGLDLDMRALIEVDEPLVESFSARWYTRRSQFFNVPGFLTKNTSNLPSLRRPVVAELVFRLRVKDSR